ncbi:MAG: GDSL-type esterase/lipase family protein [Chloroflexi bacterium]|nr:GDSL-type esterase/lipase family protein [Chloroflexota bacterium]
MFSDERDAPYLFGHRPNAVATLTRGPYQYTFVSNADGLREVSDYESIGQSVIFLGDSIVEGSSVENDETLDSVFEQLTGVVSLNFGLGSANTIQEYHYLSRKYKPSYNTKLIVLGFCLNDFEQNTYLRYFDTELGTWRILRHLSTPGGQPAAVPAVSDSLAHRARNYLRASRAMYALYGLVRMAVAGPADFYRAEVVTATERALTERYVNKIDEFAESIGAQFLVVVFPQERQLDRDYSAGGRMQDVLIDLLNRQRIPYIDLFPVMQEAHQAQPDVDWYYDDTHPYKPGHRLIGEYLAMEIPRMFPGLLAAPAVPDTSQSVVREGDTR